MERRQQLGSSHRFKTRARQRTVEHGKRSFLGAPEDTPLPNRTARMQRFPNAPKTHLEELVNSGARLHTVGYHVMMNMDRTRDDRSKSNLAPHRILPLPRNVTPPLPSLVKTEIRNPLEAISTMPKSKHSRTTEDKFASCLEASVLPQTPLTPTQAGLNAELLKASQQAGQVAPERG